MKIIYKQGGLLSAPERIILHGCNAQGVMGSGVAAQIRKKYPEAYDEYKLYEEECGLTLGDTILARCNDGRIVINCITQKYYGRGTDVVYADYKAIEYCLSRVNFLYKGESVAMPKIGAGLAGGDWNIIERIIEEIMVDCQPVVYTL